MNSKLKRSVVALATAVACLAMLTTPASANASHSGTITGGNVTITPPTNIIPLGGGGSCPAGTLTLGHGTGSSPHSVDVTALSTTGEFVLSGNTWVASITRTSSTAGTHAAGTISNVRVRVSAVIRGPIVAGSCNTAAAVRCTINTTSDLIFSGSFDNAGGGAAGEPEIGDVATVSTGTPNATLATVAPCFPPFTTYNGGNASVAGMTVLLTS